MGLKVAQHFTLLNETEMVIGEIQELYVPEQIIDSDGYADIEQAQTACISGLTATTAHNELRNLRMQSPL